jgi:hypothetical protein
MGAGSTLPEPFSRKRGVDAPALLHFARGRRRLGARRSRRCLRNLGPTTLIPSSDDYRWLPTVRVSIPAGVRLTEADENCIPGSDLDDRDFDAPGDVDGNEYLCFTDFGARVGQKISFTFTGTVTGDESPAGSVVVDGGVQDDNAENDAAAITVSCRSRATAVRAAACRSPAHPPGWSRSVARCCWAWAAWRPSSSAAGE